MPISAARWRSVAPSNGNSLQLSYDDQGRLSQVLDTLGREISFTYGICGLLEQVSDFNGRTIRYFHAEDVQHLTRIVGPAVDYAPQGVSTYYEYADPSVHPALIHNITRVLDTDGRTTVENEYGADPESDDFNRLVLQAYLGQEVAYSATRLGYAPTMPQSVNTPVLQVQELGSDRALKVYTFGSGGSLLDERFRLMADRSFRLWARSYKYTRWGDLSEVREPNGLCVRRLYDEDHADPRNRGNVLAVIRSAPPSSIAADRVVWQFTYDPQWQKVLTAIDGRGSTYQYSYDPNGNLPSIDYPQTTLPDGTQQQCNEHFAYNRFGQLVLATSGEGRPRSYSYGIAGTEIGMLVQASAGAGAEQHTLKFAYDAYGNVSKVISPSGATTEYKRNAVGQLLEILNPAVGIAGDRGVIRWLYDYAGRLTGMELPRGAFDDGTIVDPVLRHSFDMDPLSLIQSAALWSNTALPQKSTTTRSVHGTVTSMSDPLARTTDFCYDERNLLVLRTDNSGSPSQAQTVFRYDRNGNLVEVGDAVGRTTEFVYDEWDRLIEQRFPGEPLNRTRAVYSYGPCDSVTRIDVLGVPAPGLLPALLSRVDLQFDERGRCARRDEGPKILQQWFDCDNLLTRAVDERGSITDFAYDSVGRQTSVTDADGNVRTVSYDPDGWLSAIEEREVAGVAAPEVYLSTCQRDSRGRVVQATDPLGNSTAAEYDDRDLPVVLTDPLGRRVSAAFTADGRLKHMHMLVGVAGSPIDHDWIRDTLGRVRTYTDPLGRQTQYSYDASDQWIEIDLPDGRKRLRTYDAAGQLTSETSAAGATAQHFYGADGLLQRLHFTSDPSSTPVPDTILEHDGMGRVVRATQGTSQVALSYDLIGRLIEETANGIATSWVYDDNHATADLTYPDGRIDRHTFDALGRLASITLQPPAAAPLTDPALGAGSNLATYSYVGPRRLLRRQLGNGCVTHYAYDLGRRLESIRHVDPTGNNLAEAHYVHDANSHRRAVLSSPEPAVNSLYSYDELARLTGVRSGILAPAPPARANQAAADAYLAALGAPAAPQVYSFSLDAADDRVQVAVAQAAGVSQDDTPVNSASEITSITHTTPSGQVVSPVVWDMNGRRQSDDRYSYQYDVTGRLREIRNAGGAVLLTQTFDAIGRLETRTRGAPTEYIRYVGARAIQDDAAGGPLRQRCLGLSADDLIAKSQH
jgi:YD repeat-containing protein